MTPVERLRRRGFSVPQAYAIAKKPKWVPPEPAVRYNVAYEDARRVLERIVLEGDDVAHLLPAVKAYAASQGWHVEVIEVRGASASTGSITVLVTW